MVRFEKSVEMLHDLMLIQQERALVYEKLIKYSGQETAVCNLLQKIAVQSRNCMIGLRRHIDLCCGDPADRVDVKGDIYRNWPGTKYLLPGSSLTEVYLNCEYNEKETILAYQRAINSGEICESLREILHEQLRFMRQSFRELNECKEKPAAPLAEYPDERRALSFSRHLPEAV
ncbi:MAG: hypothetical protein ABIR30_04125 [Chitinophagaceae bacterium]